MGFFSELKEDLSQAVNELVPGGDMEDFEEEVVEETVEETIEEVVEDTTEEIVEETVEDTVEEKVSVQSDTEALLEAAEAEFEEELEAKNQAVAEEQTVAPVVEEEVANEAVALDETSTIMKSVVLNGDIEAAGSLDLFGSVNGNIKILGKLNVTGKINGNSEAVEVYAQGANVVGDITSHGSVKIGNNSIIRGNIFATSAVIAGAVKGDIDVKGPVVLDASAIVMGNIKSKSVQINNGAVIEGLCSQCYADVSPSAFFRD